MLELPPTIRFPRKKELPKNSDAFELLEKAKTANIVEGFNIQQNTSHDLPFKFYAEININNSRLWQLFVCLANLFPSEVSCIYNLSEEETVYGEYLEKSLVLSKLEEYQKELSQDCDLEFGLVFDSDERFEEVFVTETKYFKVWGNDENSFKDLMKEFSLDEIQNLNVIDEFPKVIEPLNKFDKKVKSSEDVVEKFSKFFNQNG